MFPCLTSAIVDSSVSTMKAIFWQFVFAAVLCYASMNSKGVSANQNPYANYPPPPPQYHQQQGKRHKRPTAGARSLADASSFPNPYNPYPLSSNHRTSPHNADPYAPAQYSQPAPPPPQTYGGTPPPSYGPPPGYDGRGGAPPGYGRQHMPSQDVGNGQMGAGLFSKLKSGILAAGSAITGGLDAPPPQQGLRRRPMGPPQQQQGYGRAQMPPPPPGFGPPQQRGTPSHRHRD